MIFKFNKTKTPKAIVWSVIACTLLLAVLVEVVLIMKYRADAKQEFKLQFDDMYSVLSRRLYDNERLLNSLVILHRSSYNKNKNQIYSYTTQLLNQYPHILAINTSQWDLSDSENPKYKTSRTSVLSDKLKPVLNADFFKKKNVRDLVVKALESNNHIVSQRIKYRKINVYLLLRPVINPVSSESEKLPTRKMIVLVIDIDRLMSNLSQRKHADLGYRLESRLGVLYDKKTRPKRRNFIRDTVSPLFENFQLHSNLDSKLQSFKLIVEKRNSTQILQKNVMIAAFLICLVVGWLVFYAINIKYGSQLTRQKARQVLAAEREKAEVTFHSIEDAIIVTDLDGRIEYMNPVAEALTNSRLTKVKGEFFESITSFVNQNDEKVEFSPSRFYRQHGKATQISDDIYLLTRKKKALLSGSVSPITNYKEKVEELVIVFRDVSTAKELADKLKFQATHDDLTGLYNRREFTRRLKYAIEYIDLPKKPCILLYLDLDQFKIVNDTCGHIAGDQLLRRVAVLLETQIRDSDTIARLGGDEFAMILEDCSIGDAEEIAQKLNNVVKQFHFTWERKAFDVAVSIGIVEITQGEHTVSEALSLADTACYLAKEEGRNRFHIYNAEDNAVIKRRGEMEWVQRIKQAYEENRFELYIQDIVPLTAIDTHEKQHFEVLLRMIGEDDKVILPMSYIMAAERYDKMYELDRWVINEAFEMVGTYLLHHPTMNMTFAVNLSGQSLGNRDTVDFVRKQFQKYPGLNQHIIFEITETAAISNIAQANRFVSVFKKQGCRFSLDDFGSGLSSFAYLKNLPVDYLKIDGQFIKGLAKDQVDYAMVNSINQIGHVMGIQTIAEYVENETIREKLIEIGVDFGQGLLLSRPVSMRKYLFEQDNNIKEKQV